MFEGRKTDNFTMRITLETLQNIIGPNGLRSILNHAHLQKYIDNFPPDNDDLEIPLQDVHILHHSLFDLFGKKGVRCLQICVGREICRIGLEKRSGILKVLQLSARILSENQQLHAVLEKYVEEAEKRQPTQLGVPRLTLIEEEKCFLLVDRDYHMSHGVVSDEPVCNDIVGTLQYLVEWITGHPHKVEEIECRAMGNPADVFRISKRAWNSQK
ncbi:MAG: hypothetical protein HXS46_02455 [Theionarchaea archaeon]|nr:MAG: hypothetical protein AYK18_04985 [Theionarchaea archaeon DG-70]MBU7009526.1 hypothetical protein [Theionarchaea archaeon]